MSWQACAWARTVKTGNLTRKGILLLLSDAVDPHTGESFISQSRLAAEAECSVKTIERVFAWMEEEGLIIRKERRRGDGTRTSDLITLKGYILSPFFQRANGPENDEETPENEAEQDENTQPDNLSGSDPDQPDSQSHQPDTESGLTTFEPNYNQVMLDKGARERLIDDCYRLAGPGLGDPKKLPHLHLSEREILRWIDAGCDPERDILPIVSALSAGKRARPIASWKYFTLAITQARDERMAGLDHFDPESVTHDQKPSRPGYKPAGQNSGRVSLAEGAARLLSGVGHPHNVPGEQAQPDIDRRSAGHRTTGEPGSSSAGDPVTITGECREVGRGSRRAGQPDGNEELGRTDDLHDAESVCGASERVSVPDRTGRHEGLAQSAGHGAGEMVPDMGRAEGGLRGAATPQTGFARGPGIPPAF